MKFWNLICISAYANIKELASACNDIDDIHATKLEMVVTHQSSPYFEEDKSKSPILIQQKNRAFIYRHPHWYNYQKLKEQTDQHWDHKYLQNGRVCYEVKQERKIVKIRANKKCKALPI